MNAISKASAFPATVQPGLPKYGQLPSGWTREPIGKHLREIRRPINMQDDTSYQLVTVKRARGGIVPREELTGREIAVKSQFRIEDGDFLISKRQIVHGACGLVPPNLDGAIVSNEYAVLRTRKSMDTRFLAYLSHSTFFQQTCFHSSIGVHIEKMIFKLDRWLNWEFDLPPLPEQQKIAAILSTWDRAIEVAGKLLANAERWKLALMQQLLTGKRRLKGFDEAWREVRLGDLGKWAGGGTPNKSIKAFWEGGDIPWVSPKDMKSKRITETEDYITEAAVTQSSTKIYPSGSILVVTRSGILRKEMPVAIAMRTMAVNQDLKVLPPSRNVSPAFLANTLWANNQRLLTECMKEGTTVESVDTRAFMRFKILLPPVAEQTEIARLLSLLDEDISAHAAQIEKLQTEKKALMQQLLTGKRRVKP